MLLRWAPAVPGLQPEGYLRSSRCSWLPDRPHSAARPSAVPRFCALACNWVALLFCVGASTVGADEVVSSGETGEVLRSSHVQGLNLLLPDPPAGYATRAELMARIGLGLVQVIDLENDPLPPAVLETKNITYGQIGDRQLQLDLYQPLPGQKASDSSEGAGASTESPPLRPGLIFIHGGAWSGGSREVYHYYTKRMALRGFVAATISYRLSREAVFPAAVADAKCAVRWLRAHAAEYQIDPTRIAVLGGSAGGHLAMMVGYANDPTLEGEGGNAETSSRVAAVVNLYGPADLTTVDARQATPVRRFLGGPFAEKPTAYEQASPVLHLDPQDPPTFDHPWRLG